MTLTPENIGAYLGDPAIDTDRAEFLIDMGSKRAALYTGTPVPDAADPIILGAVARAYTNPEHPRIP